MCNRLLKYIQYMRSVSSEQLGLYNPQSDGGEFNQQLPQVPGHLSYDVLRVQ